MLRAIALRLRLQPPAALAGSFSDRTSRDLLGQIVDELRKDRTLLVLDGVDRLWHAKEPDAETWLAKLYESAADSNFAMVAVLTGYRRPLKVPWGLRIDLTPLSDEDSSRLFIEVAKEKEMERNLPALSESDALRSLIKTLDGIPLAIKIMACTAALTVHKEGGTRADWESVLGKLRREWQAERDSFREKEESLPEQQKPLAIQPLFSLWVSLQVGLARDERAKQSLALMGLLPEGMHENDLVVLRQHFPDILGKIDDLKRRDIVFGEDNRVRLEPPILEYAQRQLTPEPQHKEVIANYYLDKAITGQAIGWGQPVGGDATAAVIEGLTAEANNIEAFIREELKHGDRPRGIRSALALGRFFRFSGAAGDHRILKEALTASKPDGDDEIELRAECFRVLGSIERLCCRSMEDALRPYHEAATWYERLSDEARKMLGEAHCQRARGDIETVQANPEIREKARAHYEAALKRYDEILLLLRDNNAMERQRQQAKRGKAYCLAHLGDATHMNATHILRAEQAVDSGQIVTEAKKLYEQAQQIFHDVDVNDVIGDAHCQKGLGDISCIRPFSDKQPSIFYKDASDLYDRSGYIVGVADCQYSLGDYEFHNHKSRLAEQHYAHAKRLYAKIGSPHGVANCLYSLGDVKRFNSQDQVEDKREADKMEAKKYYDEALTRYDEIESKLGPANCHRGRGDILSGEQQLEE